MTINQQLSIPLFSPSKKKPYARATTCNDLRKKTIPIERLFLSVYFFFFFIFNGACVWRRIRANYRVTAESVAR